MHRGKLLTTAVAVSIAVLALVPTSAGAVTDYFLQIDGVPGESQDAQFTDSIDVQTFSWGAARTGKTLELQSLRVTKNVDIASPRLFQRLAQNTTIPSMELIARKAGESQLVFLTYCFQSVHVASIRDANSGNEAPIEEVALSYGAVTERYTPQNPDGSAGTSVFAGWNATSGTLITTYPTPCG